MFSIADKLENVRARIKKATKAAGREPGSVLLLPVSKKHPAEAILEAFEYGVRLVGENYVSEAVEKQLALSKLSSEAAREIAWHFIGPVQSNKTRIIAEHFDWVQSVDRAKIVKRLSEQRPEHMSPLNVCIQVNIDEEDTKSGVPLAEVEALALEVVNAPKLILRGLMAIPSASASEQVLAESMARLYDKFMQLKALYQTVDTLSMGMSSDLELAIENGSTMVRIGTAIFGERD